MARAAVFLLLLVVGQAVAELTLDMSSPSLDVLNMRSKMGDDAEEEEEEEEAEVEEEEEFDRNILVGEVWHYVLGDGATESGPHFFEDIKAAFFKGKLSMLSKIWRPGWERWKMFKTIPGIRKYLAENLDMKQKLQLIALDEKIFIKRVQEIEGRLRGTTDMDMAMVCSRASATGEVLRRGIVQGLLRDVLQDVVNAEVERKKLRKTLRAVQYELARNERNTTMMLMPAKREAAMYQKAIELLESKIIAERVVISPTLVSGGLANFLTREIELVQRAYERDPSSLNGPFGALMACVVFTVLLLLLFRSIFSALRTPKPRAPAAKSKAKAPAAAPDAPGNKEAESEKDASKGDSKDDSKNKPSEAQPVKSKKKPTKATM